jgi:prolyl 4-hydroxylase
VYCGGLVLCCRIETISWKPRAFIFHGFLSEEECDHLVELGSKRVG